MVSLGKVGQVFTNMAAKVKNPQLLKNAGKFGVAGLAIGALLYGGYKAYEHFTKDDKAVKPTPKPQPKPQPKIYTVKKGDCVWNIAKKELQAAHKGDKNYKVKNAEIAKRTKELMEINNLHYEKDNYRVIIHEGDKLKLSA